jgi:hypothetical protein
MNNVWWSNGLVQIRLVARLTYLSLVTHGNSLVVHPQLSSYNGFPMDGALMDGGSHKPSDPGGVFLEESIVF